MNEESSVNKDIIMTPHSLEVNGIHLHYVSWGQFSQPERAVLLVHGLTNSHMEWSELGPILAEHGWYIIAPDLRGRGWSGKPPHGYGIPYHVNDLLALGDALGLPRVHLIGHSLGR
jgi:lipase